jgi:hypothetical protein
MVMGAAALAGQPMDDYFRSNAPRTKQLSQRVSKRVFEGVTRLARILTLEEQITHGDTKATVTAGDVVNRLLELGLDTAYARLEISQPQSDEELEKILAVYRKRLEKQTK